ncbi:MAG: hypothetical protein AAFR51_18525 [Pseudomonadota bacterium]
MSVVVFFVDINHRSVPKAQRRPGYPIYQHSLGLGRCANSKGASGESIGNEFVESRKESAKLAQTLVFRDWD